MLNELILDNIMEIQGNYYYISSIGFTNTRIFCDLIIEDKTEILPISRTYKQSIIKLINNIDFSIEFLKLYVNGHLCSIRNIIFRHFSEEQSTTNRMLNSIKMTQLLEKGPITLIRINFELIPDIHNLNDIEDIRFVKNGTKCNLFIEEDIQLPITILKEPFIINYTDNSEHRARTIAVKELMIKDEKLFISAETEEDIFDLLVFYEEELLRTDQDKMRGIIPAQKLESKECKEGYHLLQKCVGPWNKQENKSVFLHFLGTRSFKKDNNEYIIYKK